MNKLKVTMDAKESQQIAETIAKNLKDFNESKVGAYDFKPFTISLTDDAENFIAGLYGQLFDKVCLIETVWVRENERKKGLGTQLFNKLDEFIKENNCNLIQLATTEFQGRQFYETIGFSVVAVLPYEFKGYTTYIMRKTFERLD